MLHKSSIGFNCSPDYVIIVYEVFPFPFLSIYLLFSPERELGREKRRAFQSSSFRFHSSGVCFHLFLL
jgi:hypothetical protein